MNKLFIFFSLAFLLLSCGSEEINLTTDEVFAIRTVDIGNRQDPSDLAVIFKLNNPAKIKELRIFLIESNDFSDFTSTKASKLSKESYHLITDLKSDNTVTLPANLKAVDGSNIQPNKEYTLGIAVLIDDDILLSNSLAKTSLVDEPFLDGKYIGTWDDNIYTGFGISAELTLAGSTLGGPFWYSRNYTSCCGGETDGKITLRLSDQEITDFTYNQTLVQFMGGACNGTYKGTGQIENFTDLVIDFSGDDCEGPHTNGKIRLMKVR